MGAHRFGAVGAVFVLLWGCGDPAGGGSTGTGASASGGQGGATTGSGGATGTGGTATTTSGTGAAGGTAGSGGSGGAGGSGTTTTTGGGGIKQYLVVLAGGDDGLFGAQFDGISWLAYDIPGQTDVSTAMAVLGNGSNYNVGVFRSPGDGAVHVTEWSPGSFSNPASLGPDFALQGAPSMSHALSFQAADLTYYTSYSTDPAMGWSDPKQVVWFDSGMPVKPKGPQPATYCRIGGFENLGFVGMDGTMYVSTTMAGNWQQPTPTGEAGTAALRPACVENFPDTVYAWPRTDSQIVWAEQVVFETVGQAKPVPGASSNDVVALAGLWDSLLMAYRGTDSKLYTMRMTGNNGTGVWSSPELFDGGVSIASTPATTDGFGSGEPDAEMVYITADTGTVHHARLVGDTWLAPQPVGGAGLKFVSMARVTYIQ